MSSYFKYLKDVLGVQEFLTKNQLDLLIVNLCSEPAESLAVAENQDLLNKMVQAMDLQQQKIQTIEIQADSKEELLNQLKIQSLAKVTLCFCSMPTHRGEFVLLGSTLWIETLSPSYLRLDPAAKRVAWDDMKKVIQKLKN